MLERNESTGLDGFPATLGLIPPAGPSSSIETTSVVPSISEGRWELSEMASFICCFVPRQVRDCEAGVSVSKMTDHRDSQIILKSSVRMLTTKESCIPL
jgi:hypothetical protein